jgi:hypothetical protein
MSTNEVRHLSVGIARDLRAVYDFASRPVNMPHWATGLGSAPRKVGGEWEFDGPEGPVRVRFAPRNDFGVLDHYVTVRPGTEVYIPLRVIANGAGCEAIFTLIRQTGTTDEKLDADAAWVGRDLAALKGLMEGGRE